MVAVVLLHRRLPLHIPHILLPLPHSTLLLLRLLRVVVLLSILDIPSLLLIATKYCPVLTFLIETISQGFK